MAEIVRIAVSAWQSNPLPGPVREDALAALESGKVILFPGLQFPAGDLAHLVGAGTLVAKSKNVSFDSATGKLGGIEDDPGAKEALTPAMSRYAALTRSLVEDLFPLYAQGLRTGRTSFRPAEISMRETSWRKDDSRLHVDSFPATPVQGKRILRMFTNVNPDGEPRAWRTGELFEKVAVRFLPSLPAPLPGASSLMLWLGATKSRRSPYDHFMLKLHDAMKADAAYQSRAEQSAFDFPAGSTWLVFTDQVSHAAMKGKWAFEQTFYLPVESMAGPASSPLRTLERLMKRRLT